MRFGNRTACYQLAREDIYVCWLNRSARTENAKEKPCLLYAQRFPYVVTNAYSEFKTTHRTRNVRGIRLLETWHNAAGELSARQNQSMQIYGTLRTVNTRIPFCSSGSEQQMVFWFREREDGSKSVSRVPNYALHQGGAASITWGGRDGRVLGSICAVQSAFRDPSDEGCVWESERLEIGSIGGWYVYRRISREPVRSNNMVTNRHR